MERVDQSATRLLGNRHFMALWLGQLVSNLGDKLLHINAIGFAVAAAHGAGSAMAHVLVWATVPALVIGLIAGVLVDRSNRKQVMIVSDLARAGLLAVLPFAAQFGFWGVCAIIALVASAACFFGPARTALIPSVVSPHHLVAANAWFTASGFVTALIGTVIGSWLLVAVGLKTSLWINAAVFGVSALAITLARIPAGHLDRRALNGQTALQDLRTGLRLIGRHAAVRAFIAHYVLLMGLATAIYVGLVGMSGHDTALGLSGMSVLLTAAVIGLLLGGILAHRINRRCTINQLLMIGLSAIAIGSLGLAWSAAPIALVASVLFVGFGGAIHASVIEATLQRLVPDGLRGRIIAARGVASGLAVVLVSLAAGPLIDHAGKTLLFGTVAALALLSVAVVWWVSDPWRFYRLFRWTFRQLAFAYLRLNVEGLSHLPAQSGAIVAGNHPNVLDGLLLLIVSPRPVRFLMAEEMYEHRYLHGLFKALGCIPVYRTKTHNGDALRAAVAALEHGEMLGIFPEGTTSYQGSMQQVKRGVALLALKTGLPIVPFAILGSFEAFPKGTKFPKPKPVEMRFEQPVSYPTSETDQIPEPVLAQTLEDIRLRILRIRDRLVLEALQPAELPRWLKELQIALAALIVLPLSGFLTCTANPSLDPNERR